MSNVQSYNALIDRFKAFASGHFILKRFSHGQIEVSDLEKFGEYPFMHVIPSNVTYAQGMKTFSFQIVLADLPRDKEDKSEYQREVLSDLQRIAEDLIAEITNHRVLFGDLITVNNVSLEPFLEEFQHTLTGWTISLDLLVPYYWDACSIPAEWNDMFESSTGGTGSILTFTDSITRDDNGFVRLVNDEAEPSPNYYYGTNDEGVRGWYLLTDEVGLTCVTLPSCQTIIDIEAAIDLLQQDVIDLNADVALKANTADISAVGFSNDYDDLDNKPTIPTSLPPTGNAGGDLQGTYPNPTVHRVHGVDFQSGAPAVDDTWIYVSTPFGTQPFQWQHSKLKTSQVQNDSTVTGTNADDALEHLDSTKVPTTRTLTINGTTQDLSADRTFTIATGLTVGTTPITSGTVGRVLFEGTGNVLQESANFFWDNTNARLGIGTSTPSSYYAKKLVVACPDEDGVTILANTVSSTNYLAFADGVTGNEAFRGYLSYKHQTDQLTFGSAGTLRMTLTSGGNLLINTTTDAGFKLDVNGTARVSGAMTFANGSSINASGNLAIGAFSVHSSFGFATFSQSTLLLTGGTFTSTSGNQTGLSFTGGFTPTSGTATYSAYSILPTINQTGGANGITRGLYINPTLTAAADFRAIEVANGRVVIADTSTVTGSNATSLLDLSQTWNTTGTPIAFKLNITDTASAALSDLMSLQVGGSARFRVLKSGFFIHNTGGEIVGNLVIGGNSIEASSQLEVRSVTKGFLPPRMTTTQKNAIASPASGLVVYDTTLGKLCVRGASAWETITSV